MSGHSPLLFWKLGSTNSKRRIKRGNFYLGNLKKKLWLNTIKKKRVVRSKSFCSCFMLQRSSKSKSITTPTRLATWCLILVSPWINPFQSWIITIKFCITCNLIVSMKTLIFSFYFTKTWSTRCTILQGGLESNLSRNRKFIFIKRRP